MSKKDYQRAFAAAKRELADLLARREKIDKRIDKLKATMNDLALLAEVKIDAQFASTPFPSAAQSMGITDLVRLTLKNSAQALTPTEVKNQVLSWRTDLNRQRNLLASIHTILKRLVKGGEAEEVPALGKKRAYRWVSDVARVLSHLGDVERGLGFKR